jgi:hypothetical protein
LKAVYTQWSSPLIENPAIKNSYSGFPDFETFLWSWICSVSLAKGQFSNLELYCDTLAKNILIDNLKLPFDKVHITLDNKEEFKSVWAYGKMETYTRQTEPFVHLDADLFLYKTLNEELKYPYFFWVDEGKISNNHAYIQGYEQIINLPYVPELLKENPIKGSEHNVVNVGLFYTKDTNCKAYREYIETLDDFFNKNKEVLKMGNPKQYGWVSIVIEQYLLYLILNKHKISYSAFNKIDTSYPTGFEMSKCIHFLADKKTLHSKNIKQRAIMLTGKKYVEKVNDLTNQYYSGLL